MGKEWLCHSKLSNLYYAGIGLVLGCLHVSYIFVGFEWSSISIVFVLNGFSFWNSSLQHCFQSVPELG